MWKPIKQGAAGILAVAALAGLGACSNTVTITYDQPANCVLYDENPVGMPHTTFGAGGIFAIYHITQIDNSKAGSQDFNFQLGKLYTASQASNAAQLANALPGLPLPYAKNQVIKQGTVANEVGWVIIDVPDANPAADKNANDFLAYASSGSESVLLTNLLTPQHPAFLDPCTPQNLKPLH
jgi:hypothetical protein